MDSATDGTLPGKREAYLDQGSIMDAVRNAGCVVTKDLPEADAVVINPRWDSSARVSDMARQVKPPWQRWVVSFLFEAFRYGGQPIGNDLLRMVAPRVDWTMTYMVSSTFFQPYYYTVPWDGGGEDADTAVPDKTGLLLSQAFNWAQWRSVLLKDLVDAIREVSAPAVERTLFVTPRCPGGGPPRYPVVPQVCPDARARGDRWLMWPADWAKGGSWLGSPPPGMPSHPGSSCPQTIALSKQGDETPCGFDRIRSFKFYFSAENSRCRGYVTEKLLRYMAIGAVPVVLGGMSKADYTAVAPPRSFIYMDDFASPKDLARYLLYLDGNHTAYAEYFAWRATHKIVPGVARGYEELCAELKKPLAEWRPPQFGPELAAGKEARIMDHFYGSGTCMNYQAFGKNISNYRDI